VKSSYESNEKITSAVKSVIAVAERYPELKANEGYLNLLDQLSDAEDRIAYCRSFYNDTIMNYNNSISIFPWNLLAAIAGFREKLYFGVAINDKKTVEVKMEK
jgi:LemA protein